ncbi:MAG: glucosamine kinase [Paraglaciecola sp.]
MKKNTKFIMGLDGGGTKTLARLIRLKDNRQWQSIQGATSLTNDYHLALKSVTDACEDLFALAECQPDQVSAVFGVAGAGDSQVVGRFESDLGIPFAHLDIVSDAKISLYGANQGRPVAVVALGTGSVGMSMLADGSQRHIGGWGFCIGDEGGGAKLGYGAVQKLLLELDWYGCGESPLGQRLASRVGACRESALQWLAQAKPGDYGALAPDVFSLKDTCEVAREVLQDHAYNVEQLIDRTRADSALPLVLLGGLAGATKSLLSTPTKNIIITAKGDALDGACLLAGQYCQSPNPGGCDPL